MSKYISLRQVRETIQALGRYHIFFGTTFLVLKRNEAPVGRTIHLSLDAENREHLRRYFRLHPKSDYFFTPFQTKKNEGRWREPKYPSTSLQAVNTQGFAGALLHRKKEKDWGWAQNYLGFLVDKLPKGQKLPLVHFAIWFGREEMWEDSSTRANVVEKFVRDFHLADAELNSLFDSTLAALLAEEDAFEQAPAR